MPLFGELGTMPLTDVLPMIGNRKGYLIIWTAMSGDVTELAFSRRRLLCIHKDQHELDPSAAMPVLQQLGQERGKMFQFNEESVTEGLLQCHRKLDWSIDRALSVVASGATLQTVSDSLPDAETRFQLVPNSRDDGLDQSLFTFLAVASPMLGRGVSARELAQSHALDVDEVRLLLYRLRVHGKVGPVRAFAAVAPQRERKTLAGRLMSALGRRKS